jgi:alanine dehydrogenase
MDKTIVDDWGQCKTGPLPRACPPPRARAASRRCTPRWARSKAGREREDETILFCHRGLSLSDIVLGSAMLGKAARLGIAQRLRYA